MNLLLDFGFAWVALALSVCLGIVWMLRILGRRQTRFGRAMRTLNRRMRRHHKAIGVALILTGWAHGVFSSTSPFSLNVGTLVWVVSTLLGLSWLVRSRLRQTRGWLVCHRALTLVFAAALAWHVAEVGGLQGPRLLAAALAPQATEQATNRTAKQVSPELASGGSAPGAGEESAAEVTVLSDTEVQQLNTSYSGMVLADGVYTGQATGFRPGLVVKVTVEGGRIASVRVTSHNEVNERFYATPIRVIPARIVEAQSTDVDAVSGATFTSIGIINAVNDALAQALVSGTVPADKELPTGRGHGFAGRRA